MKNYLIGIGGAGHRCIEAITHLTAAGILKSDEINILFVDSDSGNGNFINTKKSLESYTKVKSFLHNTDSLFKSKLKPITDLESCLWSPIEDGSNTFSLNDNSKNLQNILGYSLMDKKEKMLFDFLYTEREKNEPLVEGFYGHPSIGSALIAHSLDMAQEPWATFINNMERDVKNDEVRVFLIASIFGGTGASGFPIISKRLKERLNNTNLKIGGVLLLPYFKFDNLKLHNANNDLCPDSGNFMAKSKAALFFYDNQNYCHSYFDKIYTLGDSYEDFTEMTPALGNLSQKNKPHIVELLVAFATTHFFTEPITSTDQKVFVTTRGKRQDYMDANESASEYVYDWDRLNGILSSDFEVKNRLAQLLRFAIGYTKHFYPIIENIATSNDTANAYKSTTWYKLYFIDRKMDVREKKNESIFLQLKALNEYCCRLIDWMYELHLLEKTERTNPSDPKIILFNITNTNLFNKKQETKVEIDNFSDLVYGHQKRENRFTEIYSVMSKKRNEKNESRNDLECFILDLYECSELK